jgi:hypothetical protein
LSILGVVLALPFAVPQASEAAGYFHNRGRVIVNCRPVHYGRAVYYNGWGCGGPVFIRR